MVLIFMRWWFDQLVGLVPAGLRHRFRRPPDAVLLNGGARELTISVRRRGVERPLGAAGQQRGGRLKRGALPDLVLLRPPVDAVLRKRLRLPAAALGHLRRALGYEMERETPFAADELHWDYRLIRPDGEASQLEIEMVLVPRAALAPVLVQAAAASLTPTALEIAEDREAPWFIPLAEASRRRVDRVGAVLVAVTAVLLLLAFGLPWLRQQEALETVTARLETTRAHAADAAVLRGEIDKLADAADFIATERQHAGRPLAILAAATRALPDDAYLSALSLHGARVVFTGYAPNASGLIARLADAPVFRNPAFTAPVVREPGSGLETFAIDVSLAGDVP
jgi:general secretion pathway protein L